MSFRLESSSPSLSPLGSKMGKNKKVKRTKPDRSHLLYVKMNKRGAVNSLNRLQLSILNTGLIPIDGDPEKASGLVPKKPLELNKFKKHMQLLRKYEVLFKIEFHVSHYWLFMFANFIGYPYLFFTLGHDLCT